MQDNLVLMFNKPEIEEFKMLLNSEKGMTPILNVDDIDYKYLLN